MNNLPTFDMFAVLYDGPCGLEISDMSETPEGAKESFLESAMGWRYEYRKSEKHPNGYDSEDWWDGKVVRVKITVEGEVQ